MNIGLFHEYLCTKYGIAPGDLDIRNRDGTREGINIRWYVQLPNETAVAIADEIPLFDFEAPPADPKAFLEKVAAEGDKDAFIAAQRLAALAGNPSKLQEKYSELALSEAQKAVLEQAAESAGVVITSKVKDVKNGDTLSEERT